METLKPVTLKLNGENIKHVVLTLTVKSPREKFYVEINQKKESKTHTVNPWT